jgi:hypothetical protein
LSLFVILYFLAFFVRHRKICRKVFFQHRKPFDSAKARAKDTELADFLSSQRRRGTTNNRGSLKTGGVTSKTSSYENSPRNNNVSSSSRPLGNGNLPLWKEQSLAFRQAMRQAKMVTQAQQQSKVTGIPLHHLLPASSYETTSAPPSNYIQCPTCGRSFSEKAGTRHIPQVTSNIHCF